MNITHDKMVDYIRENTLTVFGEEIYLNSGAIKGTWDALAPDLMETDAQGRTVIVEVQTNLDDDSTRRHDAIHKSVGQLIHYAAEYPHTGHSENLRLFIVVPFFTPQLEHICQYLRNHGINIRPLSIPQAL